MPSVRIPVLNTRKHRPLQAALAFALVVMSHAPARAQADPWSISGFGTLGVVSKSGADGWGFQRNSTQLGADTAVSASQDSRFGVQVNWNPGSQWEGALQGVGLRKPAGTPLGESIEWAYVGYRFLPNTRLRLGRMSPDMFLFADSRNVGFALPWARPPVDFYGFAPVASIDGADLEQRWSQGEAILRARLTVGSVSTSASNEDGSRLPLRGRNVWSLGLTREDGGLLLKASYLHVRMQADAGASIGQLQQGLAQLATLPVPGVAGPVDALRQNLWTAGPASYLGVAAQYETGPWSLVAEGSVVKVIGSPLNARRGYVSVGYRAGAVTYYGLTSGVASTQAAVATPDLIGLLTPVIGSAGAQQAQALVGYAAAAELKQRYDQSTVGVGLRWDCSPTTALKLQVDRFNVHPAGGAGWRFADARPARGTLISVLVDFVWGQ